MDKVYTQPFDNLEKQEVCVIGSGIAGSLSAYVLAAGGYEVTLVEQGSELFSGTSIGAIQAHLGGLYSGSEPTAHECLKSAINFKKYLPFGLTERNANYLVADESDIDLDAYTDFYASLAGHYAGLPADDRVFGDPDQFYRRLRASEFGFAKNVQGGLATVEPALNMGEVKRRLVTEMGKMGVRFLLDTEVREVERKGDRFALTMALGSATKARKFDHVINAGGYKARSLDHALGDRTQYTLFLKAWNIVRRSTEAQDLPSFYVVRGDFLHHANIDTEYSSLITATTDGSYIDTLTLDADHSEIPQEWDEILGTKQVPDAARRQERIIEFASDTFFRENYFEPYRLIPGVAVSYSPLRQQRVPHAVNVVAPGWQTIVPTKATNAIDLALSAFHNIESGADLIAA